MSKEYWFRQRRYGLGAGLPIHWKGWLLLALWFAAIMALAATFPAQSGPRFASILAVTSPFVWLCWRKTEGGWRWRWGEDK